MSRPVLCQMRYARGSQYAAPLATPSCSSRMEAIRRSLRVEGRYADVWKQQRRGWKTPTDGGRRREDGGRRAEDGGRRAEDGTEDGGRDGGRRAEGAE